MSAYYNDNDPKICTWLRELIKAGLIADGEVDDRDIRDIEPTDLKGFEQVHLFAGIGGWPYALRLAGWPDNRPVWTGSCPCQPFSLAGKGEGIKDERHLWPAFRWLIAQCRPAIIFGEQTAKQRGFEWLAGVCNDLEAMGYLVGAADLPACSVSAPHIRQRLWWVGHATYTKGTRQQQQSINLSGTPTTCRFPHGDGKRLSQRTNADWGTNTKATRARNSIISSNPFDRCNTKVIWMRDLKYRRIPTESALFPLVDGFPERVGLLRGAGNAIVPQTAAEFIKAARESM